MTFHPLQTIHNHFSNFTQDIRQQSMSRETNLSIFFPPFSSPSTRFDSFLSCLPSHDVIFDWNAIISIQHWWPKEEMRRREFNSHKRPACYSLQLFNDEDDQRRSWLDDFSLYFIHSLYDGKRTKARKSTIRTEKSKNSPKNKSTLLWWMLWTWRVRKRRDTWNYRNYQIDRRLKVCVI